MAVRFRALVPKYIDEAVFERQAQAVLAEASTDMSQMFQKTTATWKHKVKWRTRTVVNSRLSYTAVGTDDDIYRFVSEGTKAHDIRPRNKSRLSFRSGYKAKTRRRSLSSGSGGASGAWVSTKKTIKHPGTEAREFAEEVADKYQPKFSLLVRQKFADGAKQSQK